LQRPLPDVKQVSFGGSFLEPQLVVFLSQADLLGRQGVEVALQGLKSVGRRRRRRQRLSAFGEKMKENLT
jgi:hypothetical protein